MQEVVLLMNSSKRRRSKKAAATGAILLAVMLAASACSGTGNSTNREDQQGTVNEGPVVDQLPDQSGVIEPDVSAPEPTEGTNNDGVTEEPANDPVLTGEGTFNGLMDSHSIEIETAAGAIALQITEELAAKINGIPSDAKVKFEYTEKAVEGDAELKQNWLVSIEEAS
jgi:hypothetical protein